MKRALITGISGQDGSYLAELLHGKGYEVHGIVRSREPVDVQHRKNLDVIKNKCTLHEVLLDDRAALNAVLAGLQPHECYHLAASSFVSYSFEDESTLLNTNFNLTHNLLSAIHRHAPECRFYFSGSSEMFGNADSSPQNEETAFNPRSLYGIAKLASHHLADNYRRRYGLFTATGILYNHESPRRSFEFVTRKVTSAVAKIKLGTEKKLRLGNTEAVRDWGYAPDYVQAMWMMLQAEQPDDYVVATGITHSVNDLVELAFRCVDLDYRDFLEKDDAFYRESESVPLCGDSGKIRKQLGWKPQKTFEEIIKEMVDSDLQIFA